MEEAGEEQGVELPTLGKGVCVLDSTGSKHHFQGKPVKMQLKHIFYKAAYFVCQNLGQVDLVYGPVEDMDEAVVGDGEQEEQVVQAGQDHQQAGEVVDMVAMVARVDMEDMVAMVATC